MRPRPAAPESGRPEPDRRDHVRQLFGGRHAGIAGHCIYCGALSWGRVCRAHNDLPPLDPPFAATIVALAR